MLPFCRLSTSCLSCPSRSFSTTWISSVTFRTSRWRLVDNVSRQHHSRNYGSLRPGKSLSAASQQERSDPQSSAKLVLPTRPHTTWRRSRHDLALKELVSLESGRPSRFRAVPGILDLALSGASRLKDQARYADTVRVLGSITSGLRSRIRSQHIAQVGDSSYKNEILAMMEDSTRFGAVWTAEPTHTKQFLSRAIIGTWLDHPLRLCQLLPSILSHQTDNGLSIDLLRYLYHRSILDGLESAEIAPQFYECLLELFISYGPVWTNRVMRILPRYFLAERCPSHLRTSFQIHTTSRLGEMHFEDTLMRLHVAAQEGRIQDAVSYFNEALRGTRQIQDTVEFYNSFCTMIQAGETHLPKEELSWLLKDLLHPQVIKNPTLWPVLMPFIVKHRLDDVLLHISDTLETLTGSPALKVQLLKAMRLLNLADDDTHLLYNDYPSRQEYSYAVMSSLVQIKDSYKSAGQRAIMGKSLSFVQQHANVEILVRLGVVNLVESKDKPYLDGPMVAHLLAQYFTESDYNYQVVMPAYSKLKQMSTDYEDEVWRMAAFPGPHIFNVFIMAFTHMAKEQLGDALDILAEITHHHDPIKNMPRSIPEAMRYPKSLHAGPNASTYAFLISAFVRHGQYQAAEKCLAEIWKKWPSSWNSPCDTLIHGYVETGKNKEAGFLLTRKINAGFEVTDRTLKALKPILKMHKVSSQTSARQREETVVGSIWSQASSDLSEAPGN